jgi:hypothetical protein
MLATPQLPAADTEAIELLTKSVTAFQHNLENERHWNWNTTEKRHLADRNGRPLQVFPQVRSESVILGDGRRCNAVTAWGDGHQAYLKDAPAEDRCQAYNALGIPFNLALLLKSANAKITGRTPSVVTIAISPDKSRQRDPEFAVRCASSIEATIRLDAKSSFPLSIEGRVADAGCNGNFIPVMHDTPLDRGPMASNFRKGSTFRVGWTLQKDRFDNPANSFWLMTEQYYDQPVSEDMTVLYYWGRQFRVRTLGAHRLVKDVTTNAQEFGAGSQLTFK